MRTVGAAGIGVLALGCVLTGCAGGGGGGGAVPKPSCKSKVPGNPVRFGTNIQPIFDRSCALSGCHTPPTLNGGQDLSPGKSYSQSVGVTSQQQPNLKRVKPGDPESSYLFQKITGAPTISGVLMPQGCPATPLNGAQCLTSDEIMAIQTWILECAPRN